MSLTNVIKKIKEHPFLTVAAGGLIIIGSGALYNMANNSIKMIKGNLPKYEDVNKDGVKDKITYEYGIFGKEIKYGIELKDGRIMYIKKEQLRELNN